jgi:hypothetical protein
VIGWIGAVGFGLCGLPQAAKTYRDGHADGLDLGFLLLWSVGEIFTFAAVLYEAPKDYLIANYAANAVFLSVIWTYKIWPRGRKCAYHSALSAPLAVIAIRRTGDANCPECQKAVRS